ncbi:MAG: aminotransferase class V-fold PLP-dependent enzyme, partial [Planctomyces sp.]
MQPSIYLDNNATTQIAPEVLQAMTECWEAGFANPVSQHAFGRAARTLLEDAR